MNPPNASGAGNAPGSKGFSFRTQAADVGKRLDQVLAAHVPELSRRQARIAIDIGGVFVDGRRTKIAGRPMRLGEKIVANLGGALSGATPRTGQSARASDEARLPPYTIVFEDDDLIVVDKPAGLLTAPTPESDRNNLVALLAHDARQPRSVFVVHRLDLPTSGVLVLAKTEDANRALSERFRTHDLDREYLAVVRGAWDEARLLVDQPVDGRAARTHFAVDERFDTHATLLRCRLETGRQHQIRLHTQAVGHPVLGDRRYGERTEFDPPRMALHAARLGFAHPRTGAMLSFASPWPVDLAPWLDSLRRRPR